MNAEVLERLMLDDALGALPPDTQALLRGFLELDHSTAGRAREFAETVSVARRLLTPAGAGAERPMPAFPARRIRRAIWQGRGLRVMTRAAGAAAVLMIGVFVGANLWSSAPVGSTQPAKTAVAIENVAKEASPDSIWSAERWHERSRQARHAGGGARLRWRSVLEPELTDES
ncbi:MAG: hypothetical protein AB1716_10970 [Planctomycetota bacterium]